MENTEAIKNLETVTKAVRRYKENNIVPVTRIKLSIFSKIMCYVKYFFSTLTNKK